MNDLKDCTDPHLAGLVVAGDAEAVRELMRRYERPLRGLMHRAVGSSPELDDLLQDTWIRVVRSAGTFDPTYRFRNWLFQIAWNVVKTHWSRQRPQAAVDLSAIPSSRRSAEDAAVDADLSDRLRQLVRELPERMSEVIFLRYFEDLSEKEVAARLGVPVGTVKSRMHHGLRRLAESVGELK